ncbi:MAG: hypothetical protein IKM17_08740, partial [Lentisphaeria bacterium]|nr:hypothetical protein [Lentisphaeria bacterium]MBR4075313.1 hypothetical protein [Lentisphaeria bacterium]
SKTKALQYWATKDKKSQKPPHCPWNMVSTSLYTVPPTPDLPAIFCRRHIQCFRGCCKFRDRSHIRVRTGDNGFLFCRLPYVPHFVIVFSAAFFQTQSTPYLWFLIFRFFTFMTAFSGMFRLFSAVFRMTRSATVNIRGGIKIFSIFFTAKIKSGLA